MLRNLTIVMFGMALLLSVGCAAKRTFSLAVRGGDTLAAFVGTGNNKTMSTDTSTVEMYPVGDPSTRYYPTLRSIAYVYPDPSSIAANYHPSPLINAITGGDLLQAIAVVDIPAGLPLGDYTVEIDGTGVDVEVIAGTGESHDFQDIFGTPQDIRNLEPAPQKNIRFDPGYQIGAIQMDVDYDEGAIAPADINVVRFPINQGNGTFGDFQSMVYWREDGGVLHVSVICPAGVLSEYIKLAVVYPDGVLAPGISIISSSFYDLNGAPIGGIQASLN